jgi:hypothetical protein
VNLLHAAGVIDWIRDRAASAGSVNLLEIGAGYGGLACTLKRLVPQANYYICDLPESLLFSSLYLGLVCPQVPHTIHDGSDTPWQGCRDGGFTYIPNFLFDDFLKSGLRVDLALNTLSLSEMSPKQIRYYCQHVSRLVGDTGVFFQENYDNENVPRCLKESFAHGRRVLPDSLFGLRGAEVWANTRLSELLPAPAFGVRVRRQARSLLSGVWLSFKVQALLGPRVCSRVAALATSQPRLFAALRGAYGWCERLAGTGGVWRSGARR